MKLQQQTRWGQVQTGTLQKTVSPQGQGKEVGGQEEEMTCSPFAGPKKVPQQSQEREAGLKVCHPGGLATAEKLERRKPQLTSDLPVGEK